MFNPEAHTSGETGFQIARSLRFNSADSAYLSRVMGVPTDTKKYTFSGWVKRAVINAPANRVAIIGGSGGDEFFGFGAAGANGDKINAYTGAALSYETNALYRDPTAFMHVLINFDSANGVQADRLIVKINGVRQTTSTASVALNQASFFNANGVTAYIGRWSAGNYGDYLLANVHFIDGQTKDYTDFTEADATTGVLVPKDYTGTYGTNGFWLKFSDNSNTTAATLGKDSAGSNNWTPNSFSVTAGVGNDSLTDTPTNYGTDTGVGGEVRGNYATLNPLHKSATGSQPTLSDGNLKFTGVATGVALSTLAIPRSGKWSAEVDLTTFVSFTEFGIGSEGAKGDGVGGPQASIYWNGNIYSNLNNVLTLRTGSDGALTTSGDIGLIYVDVDNNKIWIGRNRSGVLTWAGGGSPFTPATPTFSAAGGGGAYGTTVDLQTGNHFFLVAAYSTSVFNFNAGQRAFATTSTGYKALCTQNLATPAILKPTAYFDNETYTGTGATRSLSTLGFQPDLVTFRQRSATNDWAWYDAVRGVEKRLESNNTDAEVTADTTGLTAFGSTGYTTGLLAQINTSAATYVTQMWKEGTVPGLDIVTYSGDNTANRNISHGLGVQPDFVIVKRRDAVGAWFVWHRAAMTGNTYWTNFLNAPSSAESNVNSPWGTANWSSTQFMVSNNATNNANATGATYVAYLFAAVPGFSAFPKVTGNGVADGPFVYLGFRPAFVVTKPINAAGSWQAYDAKRNAFNPVNLQLMWNYATGGETTEANRIFDFVSNGVKYKGTATEFNVSSQITAVVAFAETTAKYSRAR